MYERNNRLKNIRVTPIALRAHYVTLIFYINGRGSYLYNDRFNLLKKQMLWLPLYFDVTNTTKVTFFFDATRTLTNIVIGKCSEIFISS